MINQNTVTESTNDKFHHLPDYQKAIELSGLSLHKALREIRKMELDGMGGMYESKLSDGSTIAIENVPAIGNTQLMGVHHVVRYEWINGAQVIIRKYKI